MQPQANQPQLQVSHLAMLAAFLFNLNKKEVVTMKPDDAADPVGVEVIMAAVERKGEACVAIIPMERLMHYAQIPYDFKMRIVDGHAIVSFERRNEVKAAIYGANGQKLESTGETPAINELLARFT